MLGSLDSLVELFTFVMIYLENQLGLMWSNYFASDSYSFCNVFVFVFFLIVLEPLKSNSANDFCVSSTLGRSWRCVVQLCLIMKLQKFFSL